MDGDVFMVDCSKQYGEYHKMYISIQKNGLVAEEEKIQLCWISIIFVDVVCGLFIIELIIIF